MKIEIKPNKIILKIFNSKKLSIINTIKLGGIEYNIVLSNTLKIFFGSIFINLKVYTPKNIEIIEFDKENKINEIR